MTHKGFFATVSIVGYINYANTEKCVEKRGDIRVFLTNVNVFWNRIVSIYILSVLKRILSI